MVDKQKVVARTMDRRSPCQGKRDILGHIKRDGDPAGVFEAMVLQCAATIS